MKKILFAALLAVMAMGAGAQNIEIDGIYYTLSPDTKTAEVTNHPKKYSGEVAIPALIEYERKKYKVTSIAKKAFSANYGITSVVLPEGLKTIGESAFSYCRLDSIIIPNSVESIGDFAFAYCTVMSKISIGKGVTEMGNGVFVSCENLLDLSIPDGVTALGTGVCNKCSRLLSASIGRNVETLGAQCFANCTSLKYFYAHADRVPTADKTAFEGTKIGKIKLFAPMFSVKFYEKKEPWGYFKSVTSMKE